LVDTKESFMKMRWVTFMTAASLTVFGCNRSEPAQPEETPKTVETESERGGVATTIDETRRVGEVVDDVGESVRWVARDVREVDEASDETRHHAYEHRDEFVDWARDRYEGLTRQAAELQQQGQRAGQQLSQEAQQGVEQARQQAQLQLEKAARATENGWERARQETAEALRRLEAAVDERRER
jgi:hypothetical protein